MKKTLFITLLLATHFLGSSGAEAVDRYVRAGATGANNGTDWSNAYSSLPTTLVRGDTYYVASGSYGGYTFDDPASGTTIITIKKATVADHGTATGWLDTYGQGQAIFNGPLNFDSSNWIFDGNGTHTIPSKNTNDYGFKISTATYNEYSGQVSIGNVGTVSNITVRYLHIFNAYASCSPTQSVSNGVRGIRLHPSNTHSNIKFQQIYLENTGSDGIQLNNSNQVLIERSYLRRLGQKIPCSPDNHGQAIQMYGRQTMTVIRWNVIDASEGQALLEMAYGNPISVRFYGNIVMNPYNTAVAGGYNTSGGVFGNSTSGRVTNSAIYNNTYVNLRDSYTFDGTTSNYIIYNGITFDTTRSHNNLWYNSDSSAWSIQRPEGNSHHAYGGLGTVDGTDNQSGLTSSIFVGYTSNDFRLASSTSPGLNLTAQSWWNDAPTTFFGQIDYDTDMYGKVRGGDGKWDRGALEFDGGSALTPPSSPTNLRVQ